MLSVIGYILVGIIALNLLVVGSWIVFCEWRNWKAKQQDIAIFKKVEEFRRDFELERVVEKS